MHLPVRSAFAVVAPSLIAVASLVHCGPTQPSTESVSRARQAYGEPFGDFPSYDERVTLVEINRVRADPNNVAAFTASDCSPHQEPVPPLSYNLDLAQAARFFATYIEQSGCPLGHNARCSIRSDIESAPCDASADCACVPGSDCGSCGCGTGPQGRDAIFGFQGSSQENGAQGHHVPQYAVIDWAGECASGPHRLTLTSSGLNVVGPGTYQSTRFSDFGSLAGWQTPRIPAASHYNCEWTKTGGFSYSCVPQILFRANYYDPNGDPTSMHVVVDGVCQAMQVELGVAGNRTYKVTPTPFADGCHPYYFVAVDQGGIRSVYPDVGSLTFGTCGDGYVDGQAASSCSPGSGGAGGSGAAGAAGASAGAGGSGVGGSSTGGSGAAGPGAGGAGFSGGAGSGGTAAAGAAHGTGGAHAAGKSGAAGNTAASAGSAASPASPSSDEDSSCVCSSTGRSSSSALPYWIALLCTAGLRRRRGFTTESRRH